MAALPYMQFYVAEYLADTMHLTTEEHGAYLLLIMNYWQTGKPLPKSRLSGISRLGSDRWASVEGSLNEFFDDDGEAWVHRRIEVDLRMVDDAQKQRIAAGKASAESRKRAKQEALKQEGSGRSTTAQRKVSDRSTNKEENRREENINNITQIPFERFWSIYPKKVDKAKAENKWKRMKIDEDTFHKINIHLSTAYKQTEKKFIPGPLPYLNGQKWNDEVIPNERGQRNSERQLSPTEQAKALIAERRGRVVMDCDAGAVRSEVGEQLWNGSGPRQHMGELLEGDCTRSD